MPKNKSTLPNVLGHFRDSLVGAACQRVVNSDQQLQPIEILALFWHSMQNCSPHSQAWTIIYKIKSPLLMVVPERTNIILELRPGLVAWSVWGNTRIRW